MNNKDISEDKRESNSIKNVQNVFEKHRGSDGAVRE